jgi:hypothetical protein
LLRYIIKWLVYHPKGLGEAGDDLRRGRCRRLLVGILCIEQNRQDQKQQDEEKGIPQGTPKEWH